MRVKNFPFYAQVDNKDCGPACIRMIAKYYGRSISLEKLRILSETTREGSSLNNIANAAEKIGFRTLGVKVNFEKLNKEAAFPYVIYWQQNHFIIVYKIKKDTVYVADPAYGLLKYKQQEFIAKWKNTCHYLRMLPKMEIYLGQSLL